MGFFDGFFGASRDSKDAKNKMNALTGQLSDQATRWGNHAQEQYDQAGDLRNEVLARGRDLADTGLGRADEARNNGRTVIGDNSGQFDQQEGRLNDLSAYYNNQASPEQIAAGVKASRTGQRQNIEDWQSGANQGTGDAYGKVRANLQDYGGAMGSSSQARADSLSNDTNSTYGAMEDRVAKTDEALIGRNEKAYGAANGLLDQSAGRLTSAMDLNGASQMRSSAPLQASALARMRAAGVDPGSPEGQAMLQKVTDSRAHALDDNLAANIAQQNQITAQKAQMGLDQEGVSRGLAQDWTNQTNRISGERNSLNRADTNQLYDTNQKVLGTAYDAKNAADMGEYNDTRQTNATATEQRNKILDSEAADQYARGQLQTQDLANRGNIVAQQNGVNQQRVQDSKDAGAAGMQWANGQFQAKSQGAANLQNVWSGQNANAQNWANSSSATTGAALNNATDQYKTASANNGWGVKGLLGMAGAAAKAYAGGM